MIDKTGEDSVTDSSDVLLLATETKLHEKFPFGPFSDTTVGVEPKRNARSMAPKNEYITPVEKHPAHSVG